MSLKQLLNELAAQYETKDFIKNDPIQFPHRFKTIEDIEISAFIASIFAYGKREAFINKLNQLFEIMDNKPFEYILQFEPRKSELKGFGYRFAKDIDIIQVLCCLKKIYGNNNTLGNLFAHNYSDSNDIYTMLHKNSDYFYSQINLPVTQGFYHLIPHPKNLGSMKRMNMLLRWLVRGGEVDLGAWNFIAKSELLIPLDTHVARISRDLNLLTRSSNDMKAVMELTNNLKKLHPTDPTKYDFALFGYGIDTKSHKTSLKKFTKINIL